MSARWDVKQLASVADFRPPKSEARARLRPADFVSFVPMEKLPVAAKYLGEIERRRMDAVIGGYTYFADGDVLLAKITPCFENGKLAIASGLENRVGFGSSEFMVLRPKQELTPDWLYYFLLREEFREEGARRMTGAVGHKRVPPEYVGSLDLPLPPPNEQRRIVRILDNAFAAIASSGGRTREAITRSVEWFESYLQEVLTSTPTWTRVPLRAVASDFGRGRSKHRPRNDPALYDGSYPFVQTGDVRNSVRIVTKYDQTYNETGLRQSKLWPAGTVCVTIAANIAETAILGFDACFPDSVIGVVANPEKTTPEFICYSLLKHKAELQNAGQGSAQDNINLGTFEERLFGFPELRTQRHLTQRLDEAFSESNKLARAYENKMTALDELKKSLLHHAFKGEL